MTRQQLHRRRLRKEKTEPDNRPCGRTAARARVDELGDLLDEIDAVLEEQAVLVNFRQRSGQ
jgi:hypothetical protein